MRFEGFVRVIQRKLLVLGKNVQLSSWTSILLDARKCRKLRPHGSLVKQRGRLIPKL